MSHPVKIKNALVSVYYKDNLECEMNKDVPFLDQDVLKHKSIITDIVYDATAPNFPKDFFVNDLNFKGDLKFL